MRRVLSHDDPIGSKTSIWKLMLSGACGGIGFWTFAFPQDAIKSIIQTQTTHLIIGGVGDQQQQHQYNSPTSFFRTARSLIRNEGWARLYRGFPIALFRGIPGAAITFTTYQTVMTHIETQAMRYVTQQKSMS